MGKDLYSFAYEMKDLNIITEELTNTLFINSLTNHDATFE